jgi:hypothetical protein
MANCYIQIRCGRDRKDMIVGREYDFAIGEVESKLSPHDLLDVVEKLMLDGLLDKYKNIYDLDRSLTYVKDENI